MFMEKREKFQYLGVKISTLSQAMKMMLNEFPNSESPDQPVYPHCLVMAACHLPTERNKKQKNKK